MQRLASVGRVPQQASRTIRAVYSLQRAYATFPPQRRGIRPCISTSTCKQYPANSIASQLRRESNTSESRPLTDQDAPTAPNTEDLAARRAQEPAYDMTFTCRKCLHRSKHRITKQAYHKGTILITCPRCKNRHLISDHLRIFSDKGVTLEDILKEKGQYLKKGRLGEDGDIEFYDDEKPS